MAAKEITLDIQVPFSQEAEEATIGAVLIDPQQFKTLAGRLRNTDFFLLRHNYIWQAYERLNERGDLIDHITVADELENMKHLDNIGGRAYLVQLMNNTGTSMYAQVYSEIVKRASIRRHLMLAADEIKKIAVDESINIDEVLGESQKALASASSLRQQDRTKDFYQIFSELHDEVMGMIRNEKKPGIQSGFNDLDAILGGFEPGGLYVFGGRPGTGKSSLFDSFIANICKSFMQKNAGRVLMFSSERTEKELARRMLSQHAQITYKDLANGNLTTQQAGKVTQLLGKMADFPGSVNDAPSPTPDYIKGVAYYEVERRGCQIIFIDGMYRMSSGDTQMNKDQHLKFSYISRELKTLARELNVPVVVTHQLSRSVEKRQDKRPILSDLRESGTIEEEANGVIMLYRDELYNEATETPNQTDLIIVKNRNGALGTASLYFDAQYTMFANGRKIKHSFDEKDI